VTPRLPLALTLGLLLGPHPCNSLCLGREPKARVATHIAITKPFNVIAKDFYYHKIVNYNIVTQVVVNN
jgi:hypothetical protein